MSERTVEDLLERERVANVGKHWVRTVTACNSRCLFCLDADTPRNVFLPEADVRAEIDRGRDQLHADKIILSGGEATLHPKFPDFVRYARERGYGRVQTVTNGYRLAEKDFYEECLQAGLGEITFSLHGHTPELHDHLTQTPGAFRRLMKGMIRAVRDRRRIIVNVDVVINKQNVAVLDKIVELCVSVGVTEFDLLHVIPQANAFIHRDVLFYDVRDHLPVLHKVFRLNKHPGFVVWTNRFPVPYLEGLEELIQDPHKMLDEVNGRRYQVRRYLDEGSALDCRDPERCVHCFIEPFCTTMDRTIAAQNTESYEVYWLGSELADAAAEATKLPYGATSLGLELGELADLEALHLPAEVGVYARVARPSAADVTPKGARPLVLVATEREHLDAWLGGEPPAAGVFVEVQLNQRTAPWLLEHRERLGALLDRVWIHQPSYEHVKDSVANDVRAPADFFTQLALPVRVSGLPACLAPGTVLKLPVRRLDRRMFSRETGRLEIRELARHHVADGYRSKSVRCSGCAVASRCEGAHVNMVRDQGLGMLTPLSGEWATVAERRLVELFPEPPRRVADGRPLEGVAESLPGYPGPAPVPLDPLGIIAVEQLTRRQAREKRKQALG